MQTVSVEQMSEEFYEALKDKPESALFIAELYKIALQRGMIELTLETDEEDHPVELRDDRLVLPTGLIDLFYQFR